MIFEWVYTKLLLVESGPYSTSKYPDLRSEVASGMDIGARWIGLPLRLWAGASDITGIIKNKHCD